MPLVPDEEIPDPVLFAVTLNGVVVLGPDAGSALPDDAVVPTKPGLYLWDDGLFRLANYDDVVAAGLDLAPPGDRFVVPSGDHTLKDVQSQYLDYVVRKRGGDRKAAAAILGLSEKTLYNYLGVKTEGRYARKNSKNQPRKKAANGGRV